MSLKDLELEKISLLERLAEIGEQQKAAQREVRRVERDQRKALAEVEEHSVAEDRALILEDVERWLRSTFAIMAHSNPSNPHQYWNRKKCEHSSMYTRVVRYVLEHGYEQEYGREIYKVLDVELHDGRWFIWPMVRDAEESVVLNAKPHSLRPEPEAQPTLGSETEGAGRDRGRT